NIKCDIKIMTLFCRLERVPTFLVPIINYKFHFTGGTLRGGHIYFFSISMKRLRLLQGIMMPRSIKKSKAQKERREFSRIKCSVPAKLVKIGNKDNLAERVTISDFSRGGLKLSFNFANIYPGSNIELEFYDPEIHLSTSLSGEIRWSKFVDSKFEVGLKIKEFLSIEYG
ncbi:MAG: PilZ domain-containing protein, partial [Candidatus Aminicenantes bacterium]